jgi:hypothetical protein
MYGGIYGGKTMTWHIDRTVIIRTLVLTCALAAITVIAA